MINSRRNNSILRIISINIILCMLFNDISFSLDAAEYKNTLLPLSGFQMDGQLKKTSSYRYMEMMIQDVLDVEKALGKQMSKKGLKNYLLTEFPNKSLLGRFDLDNIKRKGQNGEILRIPWLSENGKKIDAIFTSSEDKEDIETKKPSQQSKENGSTENEDEKRFSEGSSLMLERKGVIWETSKLSYKQHQKVINKVLRGFFDEEYEKNKKEKPLLFATIVNMLRKEKRKIKNLEIKIFSIPEEELYEKIYSIAENEKIEFPEKGKFIFLTHVGTGRNGSGKLRSLNFFIPQDFLSYIEETSKLNRRIFAEWLEHEVSHLLSRINGLGETETETLQQYPAEELLENYFEHIKEVEDFIGPFTGMRTVLSDIGAEKTITLHKTISDDGDIYLENLGRTLNVCASSRLHRYEKNKVRMNISDQKGIRFLTIYLQEKGKNTFVPVRRYSVDKVTGHVSKHDLSLSMNEYEKKIRKDLKMFFRGTERTKINLGKNIQVLENAAKIDQEGFITIEGLNGDEPFKFRACQKGEHVGKRVDIILFNDEKYGNMLAVRLTNNNGREVLNYYFKKTSEDQEKIISYLDEDEEETKMMPLKAVKYLINRSAKGDIVLYFLGLYEHLEGEEKSAKNLGGVNFEGEINIDDIVTVKVCQPKRHKEIVDVDMRLFNHPQRGWMIECLGGEKNIKKPTNYFYINKNNRNICNFRSDDKLKGNVMFLAKKEVISFLNGEKVQIYKDNSTFEIEKVITEGKIHLQGYGHIKVCRQDQYSGSNKVKFEIKKDENYESILEISVQKPDGTYDKTSTYYHEAQDKEKIYLSDSNRKHRHFFATGEGLSSLAELDIYLYKSGFNIKPVAGRDKLILKNYALSNGRVVMVVGTKNIDLQVSDLGDNSRKDIELEIFNHPTYGVMVKCAILETENGNVREKITNYYFKDETGKLISLKRISGMSGEQDFLGLTGLNIFSFLKGKELSHQDDNNILVFGKVNANGNVSIPIARKEINICEKGKYESGKQRVKFSFIKDKIYGNMVECAVDSGRISLHDIKEELIGIDEEKQTNIWQQLIQKKYITEEGLAGENLKRIIKPEDIKLNGVEENNIRKLFNMLNDKLWVKENYFYHEKVNDSVIVRNIREEIRSYSISNKSLEEFDKENYLKRRDLDYKLAMKIRNNGVRAMFEVKKGNVTIFGQRIKVGSVYNGKKIILFFDELINGEVVLNCYIDGEQEGEYRKIGRVAYSEEERANILMPMAMNRKEGYKWGSYKEDLAMIFEIIYQHAEKRAPLTINDIAKIVDQDELFIVDKVGVLCEVLGVINKRQEDKKLRDNSFFVSKEVFKQAEKVAKIIRNKGRVNGDIGIKDVEEMMFPEIKKLFTENNIEYKTAGRKKDQNERKGIKTVSDRELVWIRQYCTMNKPKETFESKQIELFNKLRKSEDGMYYNEKLMYDLIAKALFGEKSNMTWEDARILLKIFKGGKKKEGLGKSLMSNMRGREGVTNQDILEILANFWKLLDELSAKLKTPGKIRGINIKVKIEQVDRFERYLENLQKEILADGAAQASKSVSKDIPRKKDKKQQIISLEKDKEEQKGDKAFTNEEQKALVDKYKKYVKDAKKTIEMFWEESNIKERTFFVAMLAKEVEAKHINVLKVRDYTKISLFSGDIPNLGSLLSWVRKKENERSGETINTTEAMEKLNEEILEWAKNEYNCAKDEDALKVINLNFIGQENGYCYEDEVNGYTKEPFTEKERKEILDKFVACAKNEHIKHFSTKEKLLVAALISEVAGLKSINEINLATIKKVKLGTAIGRNVPEDLKASSLITWAVRRSGGLSQRDAVKFMKKEFVLWGKKVFNVGTEQEAWECIDDLFLEEKERDLGDLVFTKKEAKDILNGLQETKNKGWTFFSARQKLFLVGMLGRTLGVKSIFQIRLSEYLEKATVPGFKKRTLSGMLKWASKTFGDGGYRYADALELLNGHFINWAMQKLGSKNEMEALEYIDKSLFSSKNNIVEEEQEVETYLSFDDLEKSADPSVRAVLDNRDIANCLKNIKKDDRVLSVLNEMIADHRKGEYVLKDDIRILPTNIIEMMEKRIKIKGLVPHDQQKVERIHVEIFEKLYFLKYTYEYISYKYNMDEKKLNTIVTGILEQIKKWDDIKKELYENGVNVAQLMKNDTPFIENGIFIPRKNFIFGNVKGKEQAISANLDYISRQVVCDTFRMALAREDEELNEKFLPDFFEFSLFNSGMKNVKIYKVNQAAFNSMTQNMSEERGIKDIKNKGISQCMIMGRFIDFENKEDKVNIIITNQEHRRLETLAKTNKKEYQKWFLMVTEELKGLLKEREEENTVGTKGDAIALQKINGQWKQTAFSKEEHFIINETWKSLWDGLKEQGTETKDSAFMEELTREIMFVLVDEINSCPEFQKKNISVDEIFSKLRINIHCIPEQKLMRTSRKIAREKKLAFPDKRKLVFMTHVGTGSNGGTREAQSINFLLTDEVFAFLKKCYYSDNGLFSNFEEWVEHECGHIKYKLLKEDISEEKISKEHPVEDFIANFLKYKIGRLEERLLDRTTSPSVEQKEKKAGIVLRADNIGSYIFKAFIRNQIFEKEDAIVAYEVEEIIAKNYSTSSINYALKRMEEIGVLSRTTEGKRRYCYYINDGIVENKKEIETLLRNKIILSQNRDELERMKEEIENILQETKENTEAELQEAIKRYKVKEEKTLLPFIKTPPEIENFFNGDRIETEDRITFSCTSDVYENGEMYIQNCKRPIQVFSSIQDEHSIIRAYGITFEMVYNVDKMMELRIFARDLETGEKKLENRYMRKKEKEFPVSLRTEVDKEQFAGIIKKWITSGGSFEKEIAVSNISPNTYRGIINLPINKDEILSLKITKKTEHSGKLCNLKLFRHKKEGMLLECSVTDPITGKKEITNYYFVDNDGKVKNILTYGKYKNGFDMESFKAVMEPLSPKGTIIKFLNGEDVDLTEEVVFESTKEVINCDGQAAFGGKDPVKICNKKSEYVQMPYGFRLFKNEYLGTLLECYAYIIDESGKKKKVITNYYFKNSSGEIVHYLMRRKEETKVKGLYFEGIKNILDKKSDIGEILRFFYFDAEKFGLKEPVTVYPDVALDSGGYIYFLNEKRIKICSADQFKGYKVRFRLFHKKEIGDILECAVYDPKKEERSYEIVNYYIKNHENKTLQHFKHAYNAKINNISFEGFVEFIDEESEEGKVLRFLNGEEPNLPEQGILLFDKSDPKMRIGALGTIPFYHHEKNRTKICRNGDFVGEQAGLWLFRTSEGEYVMECFVVEKGKSLAERVITNYYYHEEKEAQGVTNLRSETGSVQINSDLEKMKERYKSIREKYVPCNENFTTSPAIVLKKNDNGLWEQAVLSKEEHDIINKAWSDNWDKWTRMYTAHPKDKIVRDINEQLMLLGFQERPINIHCPTIKELDKALEAAAVTLGYSLTGHIKDITMLTHPGTCRIDGVSKSINFLIPFKDMRFLADLREENPKAYTQWLYHEIEHIRDRLDRSNEQDKTENEIEKMYPTDIFIAEYCFEKGLPMSPKMKTLAKGLDPMKYRKDRIKSKELLKVILPKNADYFRNLSLEESVDFWNLTSRGQKKDIYQLIAKKSAKETRKPKQYIQENMTLDEFYREDDKVSIEARKSLMQWAVNTFDSDGAKAALNDIKRYFGIKYIPGKEKNEKKEEILHFVQDDGGKRLDDESDYDALDTEGDDEVLDDESVQELYEEDDDLLRVTGDEDIVEKDLYEDEEDAAVYAKLDQDLYYLKKDPDKLQPPMEIETKVASHYEQIFKVLTERTVKDPQDPKKNKEIEDDLLDIVEDDLRNVDFGLFEDVYFGGKSLKDMSQKEETADILDRLIAVWEAINSDEEIREQFEKAGYNVAEKVSVKKDLDQGKESNPPAIVLKKNVGGFWEKGVLSKEEHDIINKTWGEKWKEWEKDFSLTDDNVIYNDIHRQFSLLNLKNEIHVHSPPVETIYKAIQEKRGSLHKNIILITHPGTGRVNGVTRSFNLLIPKEILTALEFLRLRAPRAYTQWLYHEIEHIKDRAMASEVGEEKREDEVERESSTEEFMDKIMEYIAINSDPEAIKIGNIFSLENKKYEKDKKAYEKQEISYERLKTKLQEGSSISWRYVSPENKLRLLNEMADILVDKTGVKPGEEAGYLETAHFTYPVPGLSMKAPKGLIVWAKTEFHSDGDIGALNDLKEYLGIKPMQKMITEEDVLDKFENRKQGSQPFWERTSLEAKLFMIMLLVQWLNENMIPDNKLKTLSDIKREYYFKKGFLKESPGRNLGSLVLWANRTFGDNGARGGSEVLHKYLIQQVKEKYELEEEDDAIEIIDNFLGLEGKDLDKGIVEVKEAKIEEKDEDEDIEEESVTPVEAEKEQIIAYNPTDLLFKLAVAPWISFAIKEEILDLISETCGFEDESEEFELLEDILLFEGSENGILGIIKKTGKTEAKINEFINEIWERIKDSDIVKRIEKEGIVLRPEETPDAGKTTFDNPPAIVLKKNDKGLWEKGVLSKEEHDIINKTWAENWDKWEKRYSLDATDEIYRDVKEKISASLPKENINIHSPPSIVISEAIWKTALTSNFRFPTNEEFRIITHPGTGRINGKVRSYNMLIPSNVLDFLKKLKRDDRGAYEEWLEHEVLHITDRALNSGERSEKDISGSTQIDLLIKAYEENEKLNVSVDSMHERILERFNELAALGSITAANQNNPYFNPGVFAAFFRKEYPVPTDEAKKKFDLILEKMSQEQYKDIFWQAYINGEDESWKLKEINDNELYKKLERIDALKREYNIKIDGIELSLMDYYNYELDRIPKDEIDALKNAAQMINGWVSNGKKFEKFLDFIDAIKKINAKAMAHENLVIKENGLSRFREYDVKSPKRPRILTPSQYVETDIFSLAFNVCKKEFKEKHPVLQAAELFRRLWDIHPFPDGNTRTSILLMNFVLTSNGLPAFEVTPENRAEFKKIIRFANTNEEIADFIADEIIKKSNKIIEKDMMMEKKTTVEKTIKDHLSVLADTEAVYQSMMGEIRRIVSEKENPVILTSLGMTMIDFYEKYLVRYASLKKQDPEYLDLTGITLVLTDEMKGGDIRESEFYEKVFNMLPAYNRPRKIISFNGKSNNPELAVQSYSASVREAGEIDLALLAIGLNGHLAYNEMGSSPGSVARVADLHYSTRNGRKIKYLQAYTIGLSEILSSNRIIVAAVSDFAQKGNKELMFLTKKEAIKKAITTWGVPASFVRLHSNFTFLMDKKIADIELLERQKELRTEIAKKEQKDAITEELEGDKDTGVYEETYDMQNFIKGEPISITSDDGKEFVFKLSFKDASKSRMEIIAKEKNDMSKIGYACTVLESLQGYLKANMISSFDVDAEAIKVTSHNGRYSGIGETLMKLSMYAAKELGAKRFIVDLPETDAIGFYMDLGFIPRNTMEIDAGKYGGTVFFDRPYDGLEDLIEDDEISLELGLDNLSENMHIGINKRKNIIYKGKKDKERALIGKMKDKKVQYVPVFSSQKFLGQEQISSFLRFEHFEKLAKKTKGVIEFIDTGNNFKWRFTSEEAERVTISAVKTYYGELNEYTGKRRINVDKLVGIFRGEYERSKNTENNKKMVQDMFDSIIAKLASMPTNEKLIIGLDTDWLSDSHRIEHRAIQDLVRSLESLTNTGKMVVIREKGDVLADKLDKISENKYSNVIVLGEISSVKNGIFDRLIGINPSTGKEEKAFVAGVNTEEISGSEYMYNKLVEMITLAIRLSFSEKYVTIAKDYGIKAKRLEASVINAWEFIPLPPADKYDLEEIVTKYALLAECVNTHA